MPKDPGILETPLPPSARKTHWGPAIWLAAWFMVASVPSAYFMAKHLVALPAAAPQSAEAGDWRAWHVLSTDCPCSLSVSEHLLTRRPHSGWSERVILLGPDETLAARLRQAGFSVEFGDAEHLEADAGIRGAPWLVAFAPDGLVKYSGGYADLRPGPGVAIGDVAILSALHDGAAVVAKPAYGCATSRAWQDRLDPLRLKSAAKLLSLQP